MAHPRQRIPLNLFGIPFGLSGLAGCWLGAAAYGLVPAAVGDVLIVIVVVAWLAVLVAYVRYLLPDPAALRRDLLDRTAGPFAALIVITPMLVCAEGIYPYAPAVGLVLVDVFVALTILLGAWFTGEWMFGPLELDQIHPGYFLPTVAGGLVAATVTATVGQVLLAQAMLGLGLICWLVLGSIILVRLLTRPLLPKPLFPTLAIEVAPAAVATQAYFAIQGDRVDMGAALLGGYGLLMVLAQLRLLPAYLKLPFMPSTWAFAFSWAAVTVAGLHWLHDTAPAGHSVYEYVLLAVITLFIGGIAVRTIVALAAGKLLPSAPPPAAVPAASLANS
ncbi:MAG TPA: hypothetical protein VGE11_06755 [Pseudonocardia sp.]